MSDMAPGARWFSRVVWLGIVANVLLAVPTLVAPDRLLALARLPAAEPNLWPRVAALLLILLSVAYVPAAIDPDRYRMVVWIAVAARLAGTVFVLGWQPREYGALGNLDLAFFMPQALLLTAMAPAVFWPAAVAASPVAGAGGTR